MRDGDAAVDIDERVVGGRRGLAIRPWSCRDRRGDGVGGGAAHAADRHVCRALAVDPTRVREHANRRCRVAIGERCVRCRDRQRPLRYRHDASDIRERVVRCHRTRAGCGGASGDGAVDGIRRRAGRGCRQQRLTLSRRPTNVGRRRYRNIRIPVGARRARGRDGDNLRDRRDTTSDVGEGVVRRNGARTGCRVRDAWRVAKVIRGRAGRLCRKDAERLAVGHVAEREGDGRDRTAVGDDMARGRQSDRPLGDCDRTSDIGDRVLGGGCTRARRRGCHAVGRRREVGRTARRQRRQPCAGDLGVGEGGVAWCDRRHGIAVVSSRAGGGNRQGRLGDHKRLRRRVGVVRRVAHAVGLDRAGAGVQQTHRRDGDRTDRGCQ